MLFDTMCSPVIVEVLVIATMSTTIEPVRIFSAGPQYKCPLKSKSTPEQCLLFVSEAVYYDVALQMRNEL